MINIINDIKKAHKELKANVFLENEKLITQIKCYSETCTSSIIEFSTAFNNLFSDNNIGNNKLLVNILEDDILFDKAICKLNDKNLIQTSGIDAFNKATITTSISKCTNNKQIYILRCYDYFIYIFDKKFKECYILIRKNKKAITMVNILLLTPYLMYGELYAVHGGLVNKGNSNILINNSSLGGKTTFAILFATHNWNIITEETTYITKYGNVFPYNIRNYFNIRIGTYLTFKDYFLSKNIINKEFLLMKNKSNDELFDYGKTSQFSIDFDIIGKSMNFKKMYISHSLKVSITKGQVLNIQSCSPIENVNSFLELSLSPTVLLFQELLEYDAININQRTNELNSIFSNTKSYKLSSGFDYKDNYSYILKEIGLK